ncbi:AMP-binding enzyme, partial [Kibdelosporangium philippinense]
VKIRGFRVELGEIENALLRVPGVRDAAAVVTGDTDRGKRLVAFYSGPQPLDDGVVADRLTELVPEYMVPSACHWRERLPLTANGKIDRTTLTTLAGELGIVENGFQPPSTPAERRLAAAWATALGVPPDQIGRRDHFFERGGTSLSAVRLAISLDHALSLTDITRHPVLADLAGVLDGKSGQGAAESLASTN